MRTKTDRQIISLGPIHTVSAKLARVVQGMLNNLRIHEQQLMSTTR